MNSEDGCQKGQIKIDGKCLDIKLSKTEIQDILDKVKKYLEQPNVLYVGVDIPLYKQSKGFIDYTTDLKWFKTKHRRGVE